MGKDSLLSWLLCPSPGEVGKARAGADVRSNPDRKDHRHQDELRSSPARLSPGCPTADMWLAGRADAQSSQQSQLRRKGRSQRPLRSISWTSSGPVPCMVTDILATSREAADFCNKLGSYMQLDPTGFGPPGQIVSKLWDRDER